MKLLFNSKVPDAAATIFYRAAFSELPNITINDFSDYKKYEIAFFMAFDLDLEELVRAKKENPNLKIGLVDVRTIRVAAVVPYIDFFIVDSIEVADQVAKYQRPSYHYYEYPDVTLTKKQHRQKDKIILGYHGNKTHLDSMYPHLTKVLEKLAQQYPLELWAMYNIKDLGKWKMGVPKNLSVRHIQWSCEGYDSELAQSDIGIVPAFMPIRSLPLIKRKAIIAKETFCEKDNDYMFRFKSSANFGRIIVFAKLGIPVVADMIPSSFEAIQNGVDGELVYSAGAWHQALKRLIKSPALRQSYADRMQEKLVPRVAYSKQNEGLLAFLQQPFTRNESQNEIFTDPRDEKHFSYPIWSERVNRLARRVIRSTDRL